MGENGGNPNPNPNPEPNPEPQPQPNPEPGNDGDGDVLDKFKKIKENYESKRLEYFKRKDSSQTK